MKDSDNQLPEGTIGIRVEIVEYIDDEQPGWVECRFVDVTGREHSFREKGPVVAATSISAGASFPQPGIIVGQIVARRVLPDGREVTTINTEIPWGIESTTGETRFEVGSDLLSR